MLSQMPEASLLALSILAICFLFLLMPGSQGVFSRRLLITLPLALSIDNLLDAAPPSAALASGISSAAWALLGLLVGSRARVSRWFTHNEDSSMESEGRRSWLQSTVPCCGDCLQRVSILLRR
jgi:hypothetical protein